MAVLLLIPKEVFKAKFLALVEDVKKQGQPEITENGPFEII